MRNYAEGQVLEFHRGVKGVARHESLEVVRVENSKVVARNARGEEREFTAKQGKCFEVYERRTIEVARNDKLLLMANRREPGFRSTNGELVTISRIDEQAAFICRTVALCRRTTNNSHTAMLSLPIAVRGNRSMPLSSLGMGCEESCSMWLRREAGRASRL